MNQLNRNIYFLLLCFAILIIFFKPLSALTKLSVYNVLYSHILLIPFISAFFFIKNHKDIFAEISFSSTTGAIVTGGGLCLNWIGRVYRPELAPNDYLLLMIFAAVTCFVGSFILVYGNKAFLKAIFPLLFLAFMIPIPEFLLDSLIQILQAGSAHTTEWIFKIVGVPYTRDGFIFDLPGIAIEVAKECTGIRSTLALFITSTITGYMFLDTIWRKILLSIFIFPIVIFINALRICILSLMGAYVNTLWVTDGWLHRLGGKPIFAIGLVLLFAVLWFLRRSEKKHEDNQAAEVSNKEAASGSYS